MNHRNKIEDTEAFKNLEGFRQNIWRTSANMKRLSEHYVKAKNIGYEPWKESENPCAVEDRIIKELVTPKL